MTTIKNLFGIRTNAQKQQAAQAQVAQDAQQRAANSALEENAVQRAQDPNASGRQLRGLGRRALAYMGSELGVSDTLAGSAAQAAG